MPLNLSQEHSPLTPDQAIFSKHLRTPPSILYHEYCVHYDVIEPMLGDFDSIAQILHVSADLLDHRIVEQVSLS